MNELIAVGALVAGYCYLSSKDLQKREERQKAALEKYKILWE